MTYFPIHQFSLVNLFSRYSFISLYSPFKNSMRPSYQWTLHYWFQYHHSSYIFLSIFHFISRKAYALVLSSGEWNTQQCNLVLERTYFMYKAWPYGPLFSSSLWHDYGGREENELLHHHDVCFQSHIASAIMTDLHRIIF